MDRRNRGLVVRRRQASLAMLALVAMASVGLSSCAAVPSIGFFVPQAVVNVPGSHTFSTVTDLGNPGGTVVLCSDTRTNVVVQATSDFAFSAATSPAWNSGPVPILTNPPSSFDGLVRKAVLGPVDVGCGQLTVALYYDGTSGWSYSGPPTITFFFTACDPDTPPATCLANAPAVP